MHLLLILWLAACAAGIALSGRSIAVLAAASPWTRLGWGATIVYFAIAAVDAVRHTPAPAHIDYLAIGVLIVAFVVAGIRDEPQAEPWWWPNAPGDVRRKSARG